MRILILVMAMMILVAGCSEQTPEVQEPQLTDEELLEQYDDGIDEALAELDDLEGERETQEQVVKEFRLEAFQFGYEPSVIEVNKGDTVRIIATSRDVAHGLALFDFGVNIVIKKGEETTVEFVADKSGEFSFYCSVPCGSGHSTMKGKLVVN